MKPVWPDERSNPVLGSLRLPSASIHPSGTPYTHVFGSVCPQDGELISLILPHADTVAMSFYLAEVSGGIPMNIF